MRVRCLFERNDRVRVSPPQPIVEANLMPFKRLRLGFRLDAPEVWPRAWQIAVTSTAGRERHAGRRDHAPHWRGVRWRLAPPADRLRQKPDQPALRTLNAFSTNRDGSEAALPARNLQAPTRAGLQKSAPPPERPCGKRPEGHYGGGDEGRDVVRAEQRTGRGQGRARNLRRGWTGDCSLKALAGRVRSVFG
jgi:hypothetical protein